MLHMKVKDGLFSSLVFVFILMYWKTPAQLSVIAYEYILYIFKLEPGGREAFVEYLKEIDRLDEAASQLAILVNDEKFVSRNGKTNHQVFYHFLFRIS